MTAVRDEGTHLVVNGERLDRQGVFGLYTVCANWLAGQPAPFKDETVGSWGGDGRLTKVARAKRARELEL